METFNYFNYFTEIEEYFWKKRGAHLLVSPLDWAIVETWQKAGIPLDAVLRGIDLAFESHLKSRRSGGRPLKSLAYCVDAVLDAALQQAEAAAGTGFAQRAARIFGTQRRTLGARVAAAEQSGRVGGGRREESRRPLYRGPGAACRASSRRRRSNHLGTR